MRTKPTIAWRGASVALALLLLPAMNIAVPFGESPDIEETPYDRALSLYRGGRFGEAAIVLESALGEGGSDRAGHFSLLGWCRFRLKQPEAALEAFRKSLLESPGNADALEGVARSAARLERDREAMQALVELKRLHPYVEIPEVADLVLARGTGLADERLGRAASTDGGPRPALSARARGGYLEVKGRNGSWTPLFVKGVNFSVALPGKYPSEFPREEHLYETWLRQIAEMGLNTVRVYTLLPPEFYRALARHNASLEGGRGALWLLQGVWTELPEEDAYDDPAFRGPFLGEMERIIDALHGNIAVARRRGHAYGLYDADVSSMTLGIILGREWEPYSVAAYDASRPHPASFSGRHVTLEAGTPMEAWIASVMDHALLYQTGTYGTQAPVSFTSWPTLDPLTHPTEATQKEEIAILKDLGLAEDPGTRLEYDNDGVSIDMMRMKATAQSPAGLFASYHAYPYYPDFMNVDPGYAKARGRRGPSNYLGYLRDLKAHHRGMPLLIAEVGVPTSRGIAHHQPQGWHHGGHTEKEQGEINARLMEDIHASGSAGGVLFAWLDEWFKRNWLVIDFEVPEENNKNWLNILDPEQNYGLVACKPGRGGWTISIDGRGSDWSGVAPVGESPGAVRALRVTSDEAYLYLRLDVESLDWDRTHYRIGIDTYGETEGDHTMPGGLGLTTPTGMEFMVELSGPTSSRVLSDDRYDRHTNRFNRPWRTSPNNDGMFVEMMAETNRRRVGRDRAIYPPILHSRSPLRYGTMDPSMPGYDDLVEWSDNAKEGFVELRLGWNLLNVTDPSTRQVLYDHEPPYRGTGHTTTDGFRFYVAAYRPGGKEILGTLPAAGSSGRLDGGTAPFYTWEPWEEPAFHTYLKKSYFILRERLAPLRPRAGAAR